MLRPTTACLSLTLSLSVSLASHTVLAHLPATYGLEYIRADQIADSRATADEQSVVPASGDLALYQSEIEDIERRAGPYAAAMTEPLKTMAQLYLLDENYAGALEFFDRAIHIERINTGLNSAHLIPLLEAQLLSYQHLDDNGGIAQTQKQLYRIHGGGTEPFTTPRLVAATRYLDWLRTSVAESKSDNRERELLALLRENERLLELYEQSADMTPEQHLALVLSQLRNLYLLQGLAPVARFTVDSMNESMVPITEQHLDVWRRRAINQGASLLRNYLERWPQQPALERAAVLLELGDWYQWNDKWRSARDEYAQMIAVLRQSGNESTIAQWLGQPTELPDDFVLAATEYAEDSTALVTLKFDVSRLGQVRQVELLAGPEREGYKIRRLLRDTHFRPAYDNGETIERESIVREYRLLGPGLD